MPTINSSPPSFSNPSGPPGNQALTFAIPAGTYSSATWTESGSNTVFGASAADHIITGGSNSAAFPAKTSAGSFSGVSISATAGQLTDINAAAGGSLSASFNYLGPFGFGESITSFTLTLTGTITVVGPTADSTFSVGYQRLVGGTNGFFPAPLTLQGASDGVGYVLVGAVNGSVSYTAQYDLYTAQTFDTVIFQAGLEGDAEFIIEHSPDLVTWTALSLTLSKASSYGGSYSGVTITSDGSGGYTFASGGAGTYGTAWYKAAFSAVTKRYVRHSLQDSASGGATAQVGHVSFWAEDSGTVLSATPHQIDGIPAGSGGFSLSGYWTWLPGNTINSTAGPPGDEGSPKTDHPASRAKLSFFENPFYGQIGDAYGGSEPTTCTVVTTDDAGNYNYSPTASNLYGVSILVGAWVPAPYAEWQAFKASTHTPKQFGVIAFGATLGNNASPDPNKSRFFKQDPAYPEYAWIRFGTTLGGQSGFVQSDTLSFADNSSAAILSSNNTIGPYGYQYQPRPPNAGTPTLVPTGNSIPPTSLTGTFQADFTSAINANCSCWARVNGAWKLWDGALITVSDDAGQSETVTSVTRGQVGLTAAHGFFQKVNPLLINSVSVNTSPGTVITQSYQPIRSGVLKNYKIYPNIDADLAHGVPLFDAVNTTTNSLTWCEAPAPGTGGLSASQPNADIFNGILALTWINGSGGLWIACHPSPLMNIGSGAEGWRTPQNLYASGEAASAVMYLPTGRLLLIHSTKTEYSDRFGFGAWTNSTHVYFNATDASYLHSAGRGEQQSFVASNTGGGGMIIFKCRDRTGDTFITAHTSTTAGLQYAVSLRNGSYLAAGTSLNTLVIGYFGNGTDGAVVAITSGYLCGLVYTAPGVLVGLWQDDASGGGTNQFFAIRSRDKGVTWTKDSTLIPADKIPALTTPPCLVSQGEYVIACWTTGDKPQFAVSLDSGRTWA